MKLHDIVALKGKHHKTGEDAVDNTSLQSPLKNGSCKIIQDFMSLKGHTVYSDLPGSRN